MQFEKSHYRSNLEPTWCKGCLYFSVLNSITEVFAEKQLDPSCVNCISGIGCSSRLPLYLSTFGMHTLHGRAIPVALGARIAKPTVPVMVVGGDGDLFSIGIGHFVHAARKNFDITVICLDNRMYAMTKNQASPTSPSGYKGTLTPYGKLSVPLNVISFAISCEATFVARTIATNQPHLKAMIHAAFEHRGFSFVHVLSPCRTFDKTDMNSILKERSIDINTVLHHDPSSREKALKLAAHSLEFDTDINAQVPIGIFVKKVSPSFEELVTTVKKQDPQISINQLFDKLVIK